jgi:phosphatidylglycerophosphate synthase
METFLAKIRKPLKGLMAEAASLINEASGGRIKPNHITIISLLGHIFVVLAITNNQLEQAALILIVFGLLDAVDGPLARLQNSKSNIGILYDSVSDRVKEVLLYTALAYWLAKYEGLSSSTLAVLALGTSFLVTYIRTKGQAILISIDNSISPAKLNRSLDFGLMRFDIRMLALVIALLTGYILEILIIIIILSTATLVSQTYRLARYIDKLR